MNNAAEPRPVLKRLMLKVIDERVRTVDLIQAKMLSAQQPTMAALARSKGKITKIILQRETQLALRGDL